MRLADSDHILVTSYRTDGTSIDSVEQVVGLDDARIGFWVTDAAQVQQRFSSSPVVSVRVCNGRGKPDLDEPVFEGRAEVITMGTVFDEVKLKIEDKYDLKVGINSFLDRAKEMFTRKETPEAVVVINVMA